MSLGPVGRHESPNCSAFLRKTTALVERWRVSLISCEILRKNNENQFGGERGIRAKSRRAGASRAMPWKPSRADKSERSEGIGGPCGTTFATGCLPLREVFPFDRRDANPQPPA